MAEQSRKRTSERVRERINKLVEECLHINQLVKHKHINTRFATQAFANGQRRRYAITKLPPYLIMNIKRFTKNEYFTEKNNTIVPFPTEGLDMRCCMHLLCSFSHGILYNASPILLWCCLLAGTLSPLCVLVTFCFRPSSASTERV